MFLSLFLFVLFSPIFLYGLSLEGTPLYQKQLELQKEKGPSMLLTEPHSMVTFNGPFEDGTKIRMKLNHVGGEGSNPVSWSAASTNPNRVSVDPACGLLEWNQPKYVVITCHAFDFANEDIANDFLKFEWRNATEKDTDYSCNTLSDGLFRRKLLHVLYNP